MQTKRISALLIIAVLVIPMAASGVLSISSNVVSADAMNTSMAQNSEASGWRTIKSDVTTVEFPTKGNKPMFLWWYNNEPNNIYTVKFDGLTEYFTFDTPYFSHVFQADNMTVQQLQAAYAQLE
jgi:hypothetical protein